MLRLYNDNHKNERMKPILLKKNSFVKNLKLLKSMIKNNKYLWLLNKLLLINKTASCNDNIWQR